MIMEWIRFILGSLCLFFGIFFIVTSVIGNFKFKFALNRMHSADLGDTLGLLGIVSGLCFYNGLNAVTFKLIAVVGLVWLTSPVASHMIMLMEISNGSQKSTPQDNTGNEASKDSGPMEKRDTENSEEVSDK